MVVQTIDAFWKGLKWSAMTLRGATVVFFSPNDPIPPPKMHPRMMAMPRTIGEYVCSFSITL